MQEKWLKFIKVITLINKKLTAFQIFSMSLHIGDPIPDFSLLDQTGKCRTNKEYIGKTLILFFYPKDDTPGCTIEVCGFRDKYELFTILGANVCGVNNGDEESHFVFSNKNKL